MIIVLSKHYYRHVDTVANDTDS